MGKHISFFPPQRDRLCEERGGAEKDSRWKRQVVQGAAGDLAEQGKTPAWKTKILQTTADMLETLKWAWVLFCPQIAALESRGASGVERHSGQDSAADERLSSQDPAINTQSVDSLLGTKGC